MRRRELSLWSAALAGALTSVAYGQAGIPLATLNSGPSSGSIPSADNSLVATVAVPREVVDTTVALNGYVGTLNGAAGAGSSLRIQDTSGGGLRNRGRAVISPNNLNPAAALRINAFTNAANGVAANSRVYFLRSADIGDGSTTATHGNTILELLAFIANATEGTGYIDYTLADLGLVNADITAVALGNGVDVPVADFFGVDPDAGGPLTANTIRFGNAFDVMIIAIDTGGSADPEVVTEYIQVRRNQHQAAVASAATGSSTSTIPSIQILANHQLVDDLTAINPGDTVPASLDGGDFLVATDSLGNGAVDLDSFLNGLAGGPYMVAGVTVTGTSNSNFNKVLTIDVNPDINDAGAISTLRNRFIAFANSGQGGTVFTTFETDATNTYAQMGQAQGLSLTAAQLLQGSGPVFNEGYNFREVWVAIDLSDTVSAAGSANQFIMLNEDDERIAQSFAVQTTVPTSGDVVGIDDLNLDGTTTDAVIAAAANRVFAQFFIIDAGDGLPNDVINSDATWSDNGNQQNNLQFLRNRDVRQAIRVAINPDGGVTPASNVLSGGINATEEETLTDLARPLLLAVITQNTPASDPNGAPQLCEFANQLFYVFDETVGSVTQNRFGLRYVPGVDISDLTAGLDDDLSVPTRETAASTATPPGFLATPTTSAGTFNVTNDSVVVNSPPIPITTNAEDGTAAATGIVPGTGFPDGDAPYAAAANNNAVTAGTLGNTLTSGQTFNNTTNVLTSNGASVEDYSFPVIVEASSTAPSPSDDFDSLQIGFSEDVNQDGTFQTDEAESYFSIMDSSGRRHVLLNSDIDGIDDNIVFVDLAFGERLLRDESYTVSLFNLGFPIEDDNGNENDVNATKSKMVDITALINAEFKEDGVATVDDDTDKVVSIMLKVRGQPVLNSGGTLGDLDERFFIRGRDFGNTGRPLVLAGLISDIEISDEPDSDGCFVVTLTLMSGMEIPQDTFTVEYVAPSDQASPAGTFLVAADQNGDATSSEVDSAIINVEVLRPPVLEGDEPSPDGNLLTMTLGGTLDIGPGPNDELGADVTAWVWKPVGETGVFTFTYKGVLYTVTLDMFDSSGSPLITTGTTLYFHPQLQQDGGFGAVSPCGVINSCADIDLYQTVTLTGTAPQNVASGGVGGVISGGTVGVEQSVLLYQNLAANLVVQPIPIKFTAASTTTAASGNVGVFTATGTGISNGMLITQGRFEDIGSTTVTRRDSNGNWVYLLHTRGQKNLRGCPVVLTVEPNSFFQSSIGCFLANNLIFNRIEFRSDFEARGTTANPTPVPFVFNIDRDFIFEENVGDLTFEGWALFSLCTNNGSSATGLNGRDIGTTFPNRVGSLGGTNNNVFTALNSTAPFPPNTDARGGLLLLDIDDCEPVMIDAATLLTIDSSGVFCGDIRRLNRLVSGYSYGVEFSEDFLDEFFLSDLAFFTFGQPLDQTNGFLEFVNNTSNGGWVTSANLRRTSRGAMAFPGSVVITIDNLDEGESFFENGQTETEDVNGAGVRVFVEGQPDFSDLTTLRGCQGGLFFVPNGSNNQPLPVDQRRNPTQ